MEKVGLASRGGRAGGLERSSAATRRGHRPRGGRRQKVPCSQERVPASVWVVGAKRCLLRESEGQLNPEGGCWTQLK